MKHARRNDPCPCGSGRKYKHCHGRSGTSLLRPMSVPLWAILVLIAIGGTALGLVLRRGAGTSPRATPVSGTQPPGGITGPEPSPYTYDPATNRHWDPGHHHWHDGPAPDSAARAAVASGAAPSGPEPSPYAYDATTNRHWDPAHRHWHDGPPPATGGAAPPAVTVAPIPAESSGGRTP